VAQALHPQNHQYYNLQNVLTYKKLVFPSFIGAEASRRLGVSLKSVMPTESDANFTKVMGATSTALFKRTRKETTRNTVKTPIWNDLAFLPYSLIRYDTIVINVGQHLIEPRICFSVSLRAVDILTSLFPCLFCQIMADWSFSISASSACCDRSLRLLMNYEECKVFYPTPS